MATIKSYTDIEQSKKLTEILSLESADMYYHYNTSIVKNYHEDIPNVIQLDNHFVFFNDDVPCWSLASLLGVLPEPNIFKADGLWHIFCDSNDSCVNGFDNPIDACYEMILKLMN